MKKERNVNFEILRILAMFMIIFLHICGHGRAREDVTFFSFNFFLLWFLLACAYVCVNVFVLISGYFMIKSKTKMDKIIKLWAQIWFYSVAIFVIFIFFDRSLLTKENFIQSVFPIISKSYWFATVYLCLYIISPILNKIVYKIEKKQLATIIGVLIFFLSVVWEIMPSVYDKITGGGQGLLWFIVLYFIGAYIRLYLEPSKTRSTRYLISFFVGAGVMVLGRIALVTILNKSPNDIGLVWRIYSSNSIFTIVISVFLFLYFVNINLNTISNKAKLNIINVSSSVFAVYLIHDNYLIRKWLWDLINPKAWVNSPYAILIMLIVCVVIFLICILIEKARKSILNLIINSK